MPEKEIRNSKGRMPTGTWNVLRTSQGKLDGVKLETEVLRVKILSISELKQYGLERCQSGRKRAAKQK